MENSKKNLLKYKLIQHLPASDLQKSSHWQYFTKERLINSDGEISGMSGFGTRVVSSLRRKLAHGVLQRHLLGWSNPIFSSLPYRRALSVCSRQARLVDMDVIRHCFTIDLLSQWHKRLGSPKSVCVIGDGQANFVTAAISSGLYQKIVSINLADILLSDLDLIIDSGLVSEEQIVLIESINDFENFLMESSLKIGMLCADQSHLLAERMVELFINIASFQEMRLDTVSHYFEIVQSNFASLYCCNRVSKVLPDGEALIFEEYPWGTADILMDELCPWHQHFYSSRPPFVRPYDGPTQHRIVTYKK